MVHKLGSFQVFHPTTKIAPKHYSDIYPSSHVTIAVQITITRFRATRLKMRRKSFPDQMPWLSDYYIFRKTDALVKVLSPVEKCSI